VFGKNVVSKVTPFSFLVVACWLEIVNSKWGVWGSNFDSAYIMQ